MNTQNLVTGSITDEQKKAIQAGIQAILDAIPYGVDLSVQQRRDLVKAGDKSLAFIYRCRDIATENPAWLPPTFPRAELISDVALFDGIGVYINQLTQVLEKFSDTRMAAGSDAMVSALILYGIAKAAGQGSNLDELLAQMGGRFARSPKPKPTTTTPPAA